MSQTRFLDPDQGLFLDNLTFQILALYLQLLLGQTMPCINTRSFGFTNLHGHSRFPFIPLHLFLLVNDR